MDRCALQAERPIELNVGMSPRTEARFPARRSPRRGLALGLLALAGWLVGWAGLESPSALGAPLDEMSLDRWGKVREAERYQLNIAEKYYREQNWKVALAEYEKFLSLYEKSEAAPYAQLKWSLCQVQLRKLNTAIKDGYQSVIDYWPNSPEAVASSYFIARTLKDMGENKKAKKAYATVISNHAGHLVAALARTDLVAIALGEGDQKACVKYWRELTFDTKRTSPEETNLCATASQQLSVHYFQAGNFADALASLGTTYAEKEVPAAIVQFASSPLSTLTNANETKALGEKLADAATEYIRGKIPDAVPSEAEKTAAMQFWYHIADLRSSARQSDKVAEVYDQMTRIYGVDDTLLGRLAAWYKTQNRRDDARQTYRRYKDLVAGQNQVAYSYREEQKWDLAVNAYQELVNQDAEHAAKWQGEIAMTHREARQYEPAIQVYLSLLQTDVANANAWQWQLSITYRDAGMLKEAIGSFRQCDNVPENYQQMAWCHRALKEYKEALILYHEILGSHENWAPWALLQIGYTYEEDSDKEKAIRSFQQVCKKFPKSGEASEAHAYLQNKFKITTTLGGSKDE